MPNPFLEQLESLTPGRVMQLAGSQQAFLAGIELYRQESVAFRRWGWDLEKNCATAMFQLKHWMVQFRDGGSIRALHWECELCGAGGRPCSHVIATMASIAHALRGRVSFAPKYANQAFFEALRDEMVAEADGTPVTQEGITLTVTADDLGEFDLVIRTPKGIIRYSPDAVSLPRLNPRLLPETIRKLFEEDPESPDKREAHFFEWFHRYQNAEWPLRFLPSAKENSRPPRLEDYLTVDQPPLTVRLDATMRFTHHGDRDLVECRRMVAFADGRPAAANFHRLGRRLVYFPDTRSIGFLSSRHLWLGMDDLETRPRARLGRSLQLTAFPANQSLILNRDEFNDRCWPWFETGDREMPACQLRTGGAGKEAGDETAPVAVTLAGSYKLSLDTGTTEKRNTSPALLHPTTVTGEGLVDTLAVPTLFDALESLDDEFDERLLAAKKRRSKILSALGTLLLAATESEMNAIYDEVWKSEVFNRDSDRASALAYLKEANTLFRNAHAGRLLAAAGSTGSGDEAGAIGDRSSPWRLLAPGVLPCVPMLAVVLKHFPLAEYEDYEDGFEIVIDHGEIAAGLAAFSNDCWKAGIPLTLNGQPVSVAKLDLKMEAQPVTAGPTNPESPAIDWFEMKPHVLCQGITIPEDRWKEILRRGTFEAKRPGKNAGTGGDAMDEAGGEVVILDSESLERLRLLAGTVRKERAASPSSSTSPSPSENSSPGSKRSGAQNQAIRVSRLHIFDWMMLTERGIEIELPEEERQVVQSILGSEPHRPAALPGSFRNTFRPYQERGYQWLAYLYQHKFGAVLADDMGLGKTPQSIGLLAGLAAGVVPNRPENRRLHLIVVPPTLLFNWQSEIARFAPELSVYEYIGSKRSMEAFAGFDVVLTTYELARRDIEKLVTVPFDVVIFDEAQAAKNMTAARSKAIRKLDARFRVCLTGTPMENHAGEYYAVLDLAVPGLLGDYKTFRRKVRDRSGEHLLRRARPFVLRRTKENVLKELPPKVESDIYLQLSRKQKEFYTRTVAEVRSEVAKAFDQKPGQQAGIVALAALMRLRQICVDPAILDKAGKEHSPKIIHLVNKLETLHDEGDSALVFSQFTRALDVLEPALKKAGLGFVRLDGSTPTPARKKRIESFQSGEGPRIFLISLKAGGSGLNLTEASHVFHLDPWWNPAVEDQASDRAHRIGQTKTVFIHRLLMKDTIEQKMMILKARKKELYDRIMSANVEDPTAPNKSGPAISKEDLAYLLEGG